MKRMLTVIKANTYHYLGHILFLQNILLTVMALFVISGLGIMLKIQMRRLPRN